MTQYSNGNSNANGCINNRRAEQNVISSNKSPNYNLYLPSCWDFGNCSSWNFLISMTNCSLQRHLVADRSRADEGDSGCQNIDKLVNKGCNSMNYHS